MTQVRGALTALRDQRIRFALRSELTGTKHWAAVPSDLELHAATRGDPTMALLQRAGEGGA